MNSTVCCDKPRNEFRSSARPGGQIVSNASTTCDNFPDITQPLTTTEKHRDASTLPPEALDPLLALQPELIVLGTGATQAFPPPATLAAALRRGVGLEAMTNAAAARTYSVLAGEGRRVVAAFLLPG